MRNRSIAAVIEPCSNFARRSTSSFGSSCYTQLTDIDLEKNGIYYYDRRPKLDMQRIKTIFEKIPSRPKKIK